MPKTGPLPPYLLAISACGLLFGTAAQGQLAGSAKSRFIFKDADGKTDSAEVVAKYVPKKIVHPFAKTDSPVDPRLRRPATDADGKTDSAEIVAKYIPKKIVHPFAKGDTSIDPKLRRAATIAEERANAHSRERCWHYVKQALFASGAVSSYPQSVYAKDAAKELVNNYGFKKLSVRDPYKAPVGSVLVYNANKGAGHVEIRTKSGFASDFRSKIPSPRPLIGVYTKL